jgi:predicted O-methyltransferase YrrM
MNLLNKAKPSLTHALLRISEVFLLPVTFLGGLWLWIARRYGIEKLPLTRATLFRIGVFPLRDHYYEPQFKFGPGSFSETRERPLPGIDLNVAGQLELLGRFRFQEELVRFPRQQTKEHEFCYQNSMLGAGDAEYLYSLVRLIKPRRIIEIGCGFSTLMIRNAVNLNRDQDPSYACAHTCIEPYENQWLEQVGVKVIRQRLEELPVTEFACLERNDILFIDSSHMIRPGGDVLYEILEILPRLKPGVYVHIHDIFTPFDYPDRWVCQEVRFWNEQYLVEAFLTANSEYSIVGALHFLTRRFPEKVAEKFPVLASEIHQKKPGSLWLRKRE